MAWAASLANSKNVDGLSLSRPAASRLLSVLGVPDATTAAVSSIASLSPASRALDAIASTSRTPVVCSLEGGLLLPPSEQAHDLETKRLFISMRAHDMAALPVLLELCEEDEGISRGHLEQSEKTQRGTMTRMFVGGHQNITIMLDSTKRGKRVSTAVNGVPASDSRASDDRSPGLAQNHLAGQAGEPGAAPATTMDAFLAAILQPKTVTMPILKKVDRSRAARKEILNVLRERFGDQVGQEPAPSATAARLAVDGSGEQGPTASSARLLTSGSNAMFFDGKKIRFSRNVAVVIIPARAEVVLASVVAKVPGVLEVDDAVETSAKTHPNEASTVPQGAPATVVTDETTVGVSYTVPMDDDDLMDGDGDDDNPLEFGTAATDPSDKQMLAQAVAAAHYEQKKRRRKRKASGGGVRSSSPSSPRRTVMKETMPINPKGLLRLSTTDWTDINNALDLSSNDVALAAGKRGDEGETQDSVGPFRRLILEAENTLLQRREAGGSAGPPTSFAALVKLVQAADKGFSVPPGAPGAANDGTGRAASKSDRVGSLPTSTPRKNDALSIRISSPSTSASLPAGAGQLTVRASQSSGSWGRVRAAVKGEDSGAVGHTSVGPTDWAARSSGSTTCFGRSVVQHQPRLRSPGLSEWGESNEYGGAGPIGGSGHYPTSPRYKDDLHAWQRTKQVLQNRAEATAVRDVVACHVVKMYDESRPRQPSPDRNHDGHSRATSRATSRPSGARQSRSDAASRSSRAISSSMSQHRRAAEGAEDFVTTADELLASRRRCLHKKRRGASIHEFDRSDLWIDIAKKPRPTVANDIAPMFESDPQDESEFRRAQLLPPAAFDTAMVERTLPQFHGLVPLSLPLLGRHQLRPADDSAPPDDALPSLPPLPPRETTPRSTAPPTRNGRPLASRESGARTGKAPPQDGASALSSFISEGRVPTNNRTVPAEQIKLRLSRLIDAAVSLHADAIDVGLDTQPPSSTVRFAKASSPSREESPADHDAHSSPISDDGEHPMEKFVRGVTKKHDIITDAVTWLTQSLSKTRTDAAESQQQRQGGQTETASDPNIPTKTAELFHRVTEAPTRRATPGGLGPAGAALSLSRSGGTSSGQSRAVPRPPVLSPNIQPATSINHHKPGTEPPILASSVSARQWKRGAASRIERVLHPSRPQRAPDDAAWQRAMAKVFLQ